MKRRMIALLVALMMLATGAVATGEETRIFVDDAGRSVEVPQHIARMVASGATAQIYLFAVAPEKLVALSTVWTPEASAYVGAYADLPVLGQLYGSRDLNLESLAALAPEVIIDVGEAKGSIAQDMDDLQEQLGIPVVHIDAYMASMGDTYRRLGELLNTEEQAEAMATYCEETYARAEEMMNQMGEDRATVLYVLGADGLNVIAKGSFHGEIIDLLADNVAVLEAPSSKGTGDPVDMEQMLLWDPDVILFGPDSIYETAGDDALWTMMRAIETGQYAQTPLGPYNWMGFPPSAQRTLGILWLGSLLYPAQCGYDLYEEVATYFSLFYHHTLSEDAFAALMENALFNQ